MERLVSQLFEGIEFKANRRFSYGVNATNWDSIHLFVVHRHIKSMYLHAGPEGCVPISVLKVGS